MTSAIAEPLQAEKPKVRFAGPADAARIVEIIQAPGVQETFFDNMAPDIWGTPEKVAASMDRLLWMVWDGGLFLVVPMDDGWADVHVAVLPDHRGARALDAVDAMTWLLFTSTPCDLLVGSTPQAYRGAKTFASMSGMQRVTDTEEFRINALTYLRWVATRVDPELALTETETRGQGEKAAKARRILCWTTRGTIGAKET